MNNRAQTRFDGGKFCALCRKLFDIRAPIDRCTEDGSQLTVVRRDPFAGSPIASRFEIVELLGCGGWSVVFKARQVSLNRFVAVKMLHSHLLTRPDIAERFNREAALVSRLTHPNVISTIDYGVLPDGVPYLIMEYLPGSNLDDLLDAGGRLSFDEAYPVLRQVCDGISAAHAQKIIHRDIKPSNIRVSDDSAGDLVVKVMDFGLAKISEDSALTSTKLTMTGFTFGTPAYMSPELCKGDPIDERSDIYSLGCVMYEMLTGKPLVRGCNAFETMHKHLTEPPASFESHGVNVPPAVQAIVMKALSKKPSERFSSVAELRRALDQCGGASIHASLTQSRRRFVEQRPALALFLILFDYLTLVLRHYGSFPDEYKSASGCWMICAEGVGSLVQLFRQHANTDVISRESFFRSVDDILHIPETLAGEVTVESVEFELDALVESTAELLSEQAATRHIPVSAMINDESPLSVRGAPSLIRTALLQIVSAVTQVCQMDEMLVSLAPLHREGSMLAVQISLLFTNCRPIRGDFNDVVATFDSSQHSARTSSVAGAAGMVSSRRLIEMLEGECRVESKTDGSLVLSFQLALRCQSGQHLLSAGGGLLKGRRVLLMQPLPQTGRVLKNYARLWGMTADIVTTIQSAREAMLRTAQSPYDVVLADFPVDKLLVNFAAQIADDPAFSSTPIILMTDRHSDDKPDTAGTNFAALLWKPIRRDELFNALCRVCQPSIGANTPTGSSAEHAIIQTPSAKFGAQILVVSEDESERKLSLLKLRILGLNAQSVSTTREAIDAVSSATYQVIFMDRKAHVDHEAQTVAALRQAAVRGSQMIILGMVSESPAALAEPALYGYDDWLPKSLSGDQLRATLRRWLSAHGENMWAGQEETVTMLEQTITPEAWLEETEPLQSGKQDPVNIDLLTATYGAEMTRDLLHVFVTTAERLLELIDDARRRQRGTALQLLARQFQGAASAVGAVEITRLSSGLEIAAARCDFLQARIVAEGLKLSLSTLVRFIKERSAAQV